MQGCLICGCTSLIKLIYHPEFASSVKQCSRCSFVQTDYVSEKTLMDFYSTAYMPPQSHFDYKHWNTIRSPQADAQMSFITGFLNITSDTKILDYGAASGELVAAFRRNTSHAYALEIDHRFHEHLSNIATAVVTDRHLIEPQYHDYFDLISMSHVLEHLWDPYHVTTTVYQCLKPGGWFFVEVPAEVCALRETGAVGSGHLWFFEPDTLQAFFSAHGMFDIISLRRDGLSVRAYIDGLKQGHQLAPRQDLINTPDGGSLRLMLRKPSIPHERTARTSRSLDWQYIAEARGEQIIDMFKLLHQYHTRLQTTRQELAAFRQSNTSSH